MGLNVNVHGGTGAGVRRIVHLPDWECACTERKVVPAILTRDGESRPGDVIGPARPLTQPGARYSCPTCGTRRPPAQAHSTE